MGHSRYSCGRQSLAALDQRDGCLYLGSSRCNNQHSRGSESLCYRGTRAKSVGCSRQVNDLCSMCSNALCCTKERERK